MQIVLFGQESNNVPKILSLCFLTAENHAEVVDSNHVNHLTYHILIHFSNFKHTYFISGYDLEKQVVNGKQYTDIFANDFGNFQYI